MQEKEQRTGEGGRKKLKRVARRAGKETTLILPSLSKNPERNLNRNWKERIPEGGARQLARIRDFAGSDEEK